MVSFIYNIALYLYSIIISITSTFNSRAAEWKYGRINNLASLATFRKNNKGKLYWFHCASLGEYEQALPLIQYVKASHPDILVACTFFSPSGYKYQKDSKLLDWVGYLPLDLKSNMIPFVDVMEPSKVIIVKNEWWWNMINYLDNKNIDTYYISSTVNANHYFIKYKSEFFGNALRSIKAYFVINEKSEEALSIYDNLIVRVSGDTKIDNVLMTKEKPFQDNKLASYKSKMIIYGSIWPSDLDIIAQEIISLPEYNHVLFPHNINSASIDKVKSYFTKVDIYSQDKPKTSNILIVDQIGLLKYAYRYAEKSYVGGGHGSGLHNILEPFVYNIGVSCGPLIDNIPEATELEDAGLLKIIKSAADLRSFIYTKVEKEKIKAYFENHKGAVDKIINTIFKND